jgi:type IV pilus assembly protein PilO
MKLNINLEALPPNQKKMLMFIPPVVIVALVVYLFIIPAMDDRTKFMDKIDNQSKEINLLKTKTASLNALRSENEKLKAELMVLQRKLPEEKEVSGLLKQVSELVIQSGMEITLWRPRSRTVHSGKDVYEIPVDVKMKGPYHNLGNFLGDIAGLGRTVVIGNIALNPLPAAKGLRGAAPLDISFNAMTYSLISELEKKAIMEKEARDAKDKKK